MRIKPEARIVQGGTILAHIRVRFSTRGVCLKTELPVRFLTPVLSKAQNRLNGASTHIRVRELEDTIEYTVGSCIGRVLRGSAPKRHLEKGMGFREGKKLLVAKVSSLP